MVSKTKHKLNQPTFEPCSDTLKNKPKSFDRESTVHNINTGLNYDTIQAAIDATETLNGHVIVVDVKGFPYFENVYVTKMLTIRGNDQFNTPIIDAMGGVCFNISANSVTLKWLNMTNATNAINCSTGGLTLLNNTFYNDSNGLVWYVHKVNLTNSQTFAPSIIRYNTFFSSNTAYNLDMIYIGIFLSYLYNSPYTVSIGALTVCDNQFCLNDTADTDAINIDGIQVYQLGGGTISVGKINVSGNIIYGGDHGLYFYGEFYHIKNVQVTAGDFIVDDNQMTNQNYYGIDIDYYDAEDWSGTTHGMFGILQITDNNIQSTMGAEGIEVDDYGYWYNYTNTASLHVGDMTIQDNLVNVSYTGIIFEMCYIGNYDSPLADTSLIVLGDFTISDNTVTSLEGDGLYIYVEGVGQELHNYAAFIVGDFLFNNNTIVAINGEGIYVSDFYGLGYEMHDSSTCLIGDIQFNDNTISSFEDGLDLSWIGDIGEEMHNYSHFVIGEIQANNNTIISTNGGGMYIYYDYFGYDLYDDAAFAIGNIEIQNNTVVSDYDGLYISIYEIGNYLRKNAICTIGDLLFNCNYINSTHESGIYFDQIEYIGYGMYDASRCTMGDIQTNYNTIIAGGGYGIKVDYYDFGAYMGELENGTCSFIMGNITFNYNNITSYDDGIYTCDIDDIGYCIYGASTCTIGNFEFCYNIVNSTNNYGLDLSDPEYFGYDLYDTARFTMGDLHVDWNNIIAGGRDGIYIYYDEIGYDLGDDTSDAVNVFIGDITFNNNTIVSTDEGIYAYDTFYNIGSYMYGSSSFSIGNIQFNDNNISSQTYGIYLYDVYEFGYDLYDDSQCTMGNFEVCRNIVNTTLGDEGIVLYAYDFGYDIEDNATFTMGNILVNSNDITSYSFGLNIYWIGDVGEDLYNNATVSLGTFDVSFNIITNANDYGMYYCIGCFGYCVYDQSTFTMKDITCTNNIINSADDGLNVDWVYDNNMCVNSNASSSNKGIYIAYNIINATGVGILVSNSDHIIVARNTITNANVGVNLVDSYNVTVAYHSLNGTINQGILLDTGSYRTSYNNLILANTINGSQNNNGIELINTSNTSIVRNSIRNNAHTGINVTDSQNNLFYHNNIINNIAQDYDSSSNNAWNNTYPTGGNYWSDYNGVDLFCGQYQDIPGSDGIGDTDYNINGTENNDFYPLMDSVTINHPSLVTPSSPTPANGATGVSTTPTLGWLGGDPDNDYNNYDVYFGTTNPPAYLDTVYLTNLTNLSYLPGALINYQIYYWKIVAWDSFNDVISGPIWSFTTEKSGSQEMPPYAPSNPAPPNGTADVSILTNLSWTGGDPYSKETVTYDLYFGTTATPPLISANQSTTTYTPDEPLSYLTTYYWHVVAWNSQNLSNCSTNWSFTTINEPNTPPFTPSNPSPEDGATDIPIITDLSWTGGDPNQNDTTSYDFYFGTSTDLTLVSHNLSTSFYDPGLLLYSTTYYWSIVAWDNHNASTGGPIWAFTTHINNPPNQPCNPYPQNGAQNISINVELSWSGGDSDPGDTCLYDVYFGANYPLSQLAHNISNSYYDISELNYSAEYHWKIIAWDNHGFSTSSPDWTFFTHNNNPPNVPNSPKPSDGEQNVILTPILSWSGGDPDGDPVGYDVYFGKVPNPPIVAYNQSISSFAPGVLQFNITYYWRIVSRDCHNSESYGPIWQFTTLQNQPPSPPEINGPTQGKKGKPMSYTFISIDPENQNISYEIDWGDGNITHWFGPFGSNVLISLNHTWNNKGSYVIKARAKDTLGAISDWGTLPVTMPYVPHPLLQFLRDLLERLLHAFPLSQGLKY